MYSLDDSLDELDLEPPIPGGGTGPPIAFDPTSAAIQVGIQAAKFIPGVREVLDAPVKLVGKIFGFGGSNTALRRFKKKQTRQAGAKWGESDCLLNQPELTCKGAVPGVTQHLREGKCYFKSKPPHSEFVQAYRLIYRPCVNALKDCREARGQGKGLWDNFPQNDPFVSRRGEGYKKRWEKQYNQYYQACQQQEQGGALGIGPWILVGLAGLAVIALRGKVK